MMKYSQQWAQIPNLNNLESNQNTTSKINISYNFNTISKNE